MRLQRAVVRQSAVEPSMLFTTPTGRSRDGTRTGVTLSTDPDSPTSGSGSSGRFEVRQTVNADALQRGFVLREAPDAPRANGNRRDALPEGEWARRTKPP